MKQQYNDDIIFSEFPNIKGRYIAFDTETTGLNYTKDHIISIAGIEIINGKLTGNQFHAYLQPRIYITEDAIKVHKLNNNFYKDYFKDTYESDLQVMKNFRNFIGDSLIFAHNASFDYHFLYKDFKFFGIPVIDKSRFRCSMRMFKKVFSETDTTLKAKNKLPFCCKYVGIKVMSDDFHSAIFDAYMCSKLVIFMFSFLEQNSIQSKSIKSKFKERNYEVNGLVDLDKEKEENDLNNFLNSVNFLNKFEPQLKPTEEKESIKDNDININDIEDEILEQIDLFENHKESNPNNDSNEVKSSIFDFIEDFINERPSKDSSQEKFLQRKQASPYSDSYDTTAASIISNKNKLKDNLVNITSEELNLILNED